MGSRISSTRRLAALALASTLVLSGCGAAGGAGDNGTASSSGTPHSGGILRIAEPTEILNCIDPSQAAWTPTRSLVRQFAESLTDQDPKTGEIKPWLASDWTVGDDGKTYTFNLKHDITFSNGEPFNADAVVANFNAFLDEANSGIGPITYITGLESATKVDDDTVTFTFSQPNAAFLQATSTTTLGLLAPESLKQTPQERCHGKNLYGTGPFTLTQWDISSKTTLARREGYNSPSPFETRSKGDAYLEGIEVSYIPEQSVRTGSLAGGQIDAIWQAAEGEIYENEAAQIKAAGGTIQSRAIPGTSYDIYPNVRDESRPLSDKNVREAISLALDRAAYAHTVYRQDYPVVKGILGSSTPMFQATPDAIKYDVDKANDLLDKAGWKLGEDGYRYKDGRKLTLVLLDFVKNPGQDLLVDQLRQVGADLQIEISTWSDSVNKEKTGEYDLSMLWSYTRSDPSAIDNLLNVKDGTGNKYARWNIANAEQRAKLDALFSAGIKELDSAKRESIYKELQQYLADEYLQIPIYERVGDLALGANVHDVRFTAESFISLYGTWID